MCIRDRYITGRKLPDKAIDLIDEAASRLKMEIDSSPTEIDQLKRAVDRLRIEELALKKEKDDASKARLEKLREDLGERQKELSALEARWKDVDKRQGHPLAAARSRRSGPGRGAR